MHTPLPFKQEEEKILASKTLIAHQRPIGEVRRPSLRGGMTKFYGGKIRPSHEGIGKSDKYTNQTIESYGVRRTSPGGSWIQRESLSDGISSPPNLIFQPPDSPKNCQV